MIIDVVDLFDYSLIGKWNCGRELVSSSTRTQFVPDRGLKRRDDSFIRGNAWRQDHTNPRRTSFGRGKETVLKDSDKEDGGQGC